MVNKDAYITDGSSASERRRHEE